MAWFLKALTYVRATVGVGVRETVGVGTAIVIPAQAGVPAVGVTSG